MTSIFVVFNKLDSLKDQIETSIVTILKCLSQILEALIRNEWYDQSEQCQTQQQRTSILAQDYIRIHIILTR